MLFANPVYENGSIRGILYELMLKSGCLPTDGVIYNNQYYSIDNGELVIVLDEIECHYSSRLFPHPKN